MKLTLQDLFSNIPDLDCKGLCHQSCGPIVISHAEQEHIRTYCAENGIRFKPLPTKLTLESIIAHTRSSLDGDTACLECVYLKDNKCQVYEARPIICRLFGISEGMECPYGCKPASKLSFEDGHTLIKEAKKIEA